MADDINMLRNRIIELEAELSIYKQNKVGSREKIDEYQKLYHEVHQWFQDNNIADDDQNFVIQCSSRKEELFRFECLGGWFKGLTNYQMTV